MSLQPSNRVYLVVYPNQLSSLSSILVKYTQKEKKVTKQFKSLVTQLTNMKTTLQDGTPSTFVKETIRLKGKVPIKIIRAWLPFDITAGGK